MRPSGARPTAMPLRCRNRPPGGFSARAARWEIRAAEHRLQRHDALAEDALLAHRHRAGSTRRHKAAATWPSARSFHSSAVKICGMRSQNQGRFSPRPIPGDVEGDAHFAHRGLELLVGAAEVRAGGRGEASKKRRIDIPRLPVGAEQLVPMRALDRCSPVSPDAPGDAFQAPLAGQAQIARAHRIIHFRTAAAEIPRR